MKVTAKTHLELEKLTDYIHDFYVVFPARRLEVRDGRLSLRLEDAEGIRSRTGEQYLLTFNHVRRVVSKYDVKSLPGPTAQLIDINYDPSGPFLEFDFVHPARLILYVNQIDVILEST